MGTSLSTHLHGHVHVSPSLNAQPNPLKLSTAATTTNHAEDSGLLHQPSPSSCEQSSTCNTEPQLHIHTMIQQEMKIQQQRVPIYFN